MRVLLATTNPHKLDEVRAVIDDPWCELVSLADVGLSIEEPVEDQLTFEGNAELKARYYAQHAGMVCLADDSGLEVDALGGKPGVHSARYSGVAGPRSEVAPANNRLLLESLADRADRTARFVCVMALAAPQPNDKTRRAIDSLAHVIKPNEPTTLLALERGTVEGRILLPHEAADPGRPEAGRGEHGFGYDPLFVLPDDHPWAGQTTAQLSPEQKNAISHRGVASRLIRERMKTLWQED